MSLRLLRCDAFPQQGKTFLAFALPRSCCSEKALGFCAAPNETEPMKLCSTWLKMALLQVRADNARLERFSSADSAVWHRASHRAFPGAMLRSMRFAFAADDGVQSEKIRRAP